MKSIVNYFRSHKKNKKEAECLALENETYKAIQKQELKFRQIIDVVDTSIYWKDRDGRYLGCNQYVLNIAGLNSLDEIIGKTDFDLFWRDQAPKIKEIDDWVMRTGNSYRGEERISVDYANRVAAFFTIKNPLFDSNGQVIGIVGTSIDITVKKEAEHLVFENAAYKIIQEQEKKFGQIIDVVDSSIYWKDRDGRYLGCNQYVLNIAGLSSLDEIIGKTDFDLLWKKEAPKIKEIDELVMSTGSSYSGEEVISIDSGNLLIGFSVKTPLFDNNGQVVGIVGTSIDITAKKEAERLTLENETHKAIQEQQHKFRKIVEQVVHDIRSPIGSMKMILPRCKNLPELERVSLNKAATRIMDISYRLLNEVSPPQEEAEDSNKGNEPTLISNEILEVVAEKRYEYQEKTIEFCAHISSDAYFVFLNTNDSDFKRMLSNLINNAVDAIKDKIGKIDLYLNVVGEQIQIIVQDNGCGMPPDVKGKILNSIFVTAGKTDGHGIGFGQIRDTLESSNGNLDIESSLGVGTKISLTFPEAESPDWIANQIELFNDDIIVVLDDDESIHGAWETRFQMAAPKILRKHFEQGTEAIAFINHLDKSEKEKVFLLTDYELLNQELHGLNVVKETGITRSILVTSHNNSEKVRELAKLHNTKILPKPLAAHISIEFRERRSKSSEEQYTEIDYTPKKVNIVIVEDNEAYSDGLVAFIFDDEEPDQYFKPEDFLKNIHNYTKDTKIYLDNNYDNSFLKGIDIAKELHEQGYKYLYLLSGEVFQKGDLPSYLTLIEKHDIDGIKNSMKG